MNASVAVGNVSKWFGQKVAVSEVSYDFGPGVTGLLGPNGAGKTTLLRLLVGLQKPSEGTVRVLGRDPRRHPAIYRQIALVPEEEAVYGFQSAREFVALNAALHRLPDPHAAADAALATVELSDVAERRLATFSKGMRQRAKVAAALVHDPEVLFLDEPLNGTDPVQRAHLIRLFVELGEQGRTVIVSSHVLHEVERMAGRVLAMVDGRLAASGTVTALRAAMTDIPRTIRVDADAARRLAAALMEQPWVHGVALQDDTLRVQVRDPMALGRALPAMARSLEVRLTRVDPEDESLESVFRYLVGSR